MDANNRRKKLMGIISMSDMPITGIELAKNLSVTRQVIVKDIALLRAGGLPIVATSAGYMLMDVNGRIRPMKVFTCRHSTLEEAETELMLIVENGGKIRDVIIEHPVYGEISGMLMLKTPEAVKELIARLRQKDALMISSITDGVHMHTVEAASEKELLNIEAELELAGILMK